MAQRRIIFAYTGATSSPILPITVGATVDNNGDGNVVVASIITSSQYRYYNDGASVTLVAPATNADGQAFAFWRINDVQYPNGQLSITFTVSQNAGAVAYYKAANGGLSAYLQQTHFNGGMTKAEVWINGQGDFAEQQQLFAQDMKAVVLGGSGNYYYEWSNGDQGVFAFGTLSDASYGDSSTNSIMWVRITDTTTLESVTLYQRLYYFEKIRFNLTVTPQNCITGNGTISVAVDPQDVSGPFQYYWFNGTFGDTITFPFPTGTNHFRFDFSDQVVVVEVWFPITGVLPQIAFNLSGTDNSDLTTPNGTAQVTGVTGGTAPYTYAWSFMGATTPNVSGLPEGTYSVTVTDSNSCSMSASITINGPATQEEKDANCLDDEENEIVWKAIDALCNECEKCEE